MYLALHAAGPIRASLIFNLEPVVAIAAAALILGERLAPLQIAGVALVIGALSLARLARAKA
jgi:drug/metabolite transporter (DMT)-like permease